MSPRRKSSPAPELERHQIAALEELLEVYEWTGLEQTRNLEFALEKLRARAEALLESQGQLRERSAILRSILGNMAEGVVVVNTQGIVIHLNPAAERLLEVRAAETPPHGWIERVDLRLPDRETPFPPEQLPIQRALSGEIVDECEAFLRSERHPEGIWVRMHSRPLGDSSRRHGALFVVRDVTDAKRAELALRESNTRLERALSDLRNAQRQVVQQERLKALGQMASGVAHDFNNALSPVLGFSEIVLARPDTLENREQVLRYFQMINTAARDAAHIIDRLLQFYRGPNSLDTVLPVRLSAIVEEVVALTQPKWKALALARGAQITLETSLAELPAIPANPAELRELLINLIFNAVEAMPLGGTIAIRTAMRSCTRSTSARPNDPPDCGAESKSGAATDPWILLEVRDTGVGMSPEVRQRCLEPFFSTKGERGNGLGLATVFGIVQRHKGTIEIESELGRGTTFRISIPMLAADTGAVDEDGPELEIRPLRVLLVDDEAPVREVLGAYLTLDGHSLVTASTGFEALEVFDADSFDLVITDLVMPEVCGDELCMQFLRLAPEMPIVLVTGFGDIVNESGLEACGARVIVAKPVTIADLRRAVAHALRTPPARQVA